MNFKPKWIPLFSVSAGAIGLALQFWLFSTGIDHRGLLRPEHPAGYLCFILLALCFAAFYLCLWPLTGKPAYEKLFPQGSLSLIGAVLGAAGILYAVLSDLSAQQNRLTILCGIAGLLAVCGMLVGGAVRQRNKKPHVLCHSFVAVFLMVYLISRYRQWSTDPQLLEYFFPLAACICLMLTAYHRATLDNLTGSRRWFVFFNYSSVFLCLVAAGCENWLFYLGFALWCLANGCSLTPAKEMKLPKSVMFCLKKLEEYGFEGYVVGGCVRDALLGLTPQDYDMCTDATPKEIAQIFRKQELVRNGEKHGTIGVILAGQVYEITTFRTEGTYSDGRHPDTVSFVQNLQEDLSRRDFTVNAMAYSPSTGFIDLFGGQQDLQDGILRTVGDPEKRFAEDALRILRGVRFAVRFDWMVEPKTLQAMGSLAPLMDKLAKERVYTELSKLLPVINAQQLVQFAPVITQVIPELKASVGFEQRSPHHAYDVYTHTAYVVEALPSDLTLRFAGLLHDIAKPQAFTQDADGRGHFYGHAQAGAQLADQVLTDLRAPTALHQQVVLLIEHHMTPIEADKKLLRRRLRAFGTETLQQLLILQKADFCSKGVDDEPETDFAAIDVLLAEITQEDACLNVKDLAIGGKELLELGIAAGPAIGECLEHLLDLVQDENIANEPAQLLAAAKAYFEKENG